MRFLIIITITTLFACNPATNNFSDETLVYIDDFKDKRQSDSLFQFLSDTFSMHRYEAALAFASIQDTLVIEKLLPSLNDPHKQVRLAVAYALGQTGGRIASRALINAATNETDPEVLTMIAEAIGKTGNLNELRFATEENTSFFEGLSWGYYRLGVRGLADSSVNKTIIKFLDPAYKKSIRLAAAHFFQRAGKNIEPVSEELFRCSKADEDPEVRMAVVLALRKINTPESLKEIVTVLTNDDDYRVKVNAIRALQPFNFTMTKSYFFKAIQDTNYHVSVAAAETLRLVDTEKYRSEVIQEARKSRNWRIQACLYEAALKFPNSKDLTEEVADLVKKSSDNYQKAALLTALGQSPMAAGFLKNQLLTSDVPVVKSAAATSLVTIGKRNDADNLLKKLLADIYRDGIKIGDPAVTGIISEFLSDSSLGYNRHIKNIEFLYEAKRKMFLPKDNEALQSLEKVIACFEGREPTPVVNTYNHPLNWKRIKSISRKQQAIILTSKGTITLQLLVDEAPGSVANFVELVEKNYFDSLYFHRVVPNFVVQAGCNRGDGWGSEDYSIRSEFTPRRYKAGSVGMASAGKDTEGTQWFITHSPAPHLDGRYTIFAEVIAGMNVVHKIEVGDRILRVSLTEGK